MNDDIFRLQQEVNAVRARIVRLQREQAAAQARRKRQQQIWQLQRDADWAAWKEQLRRKIAANPGLAEVYERVLKRVAEKRASN